MKRYKSSMIISLLLTVASVPLSFAGPGWRGPAKVVEVTVDYYNSGLALKFENSVSLNGCESSNVIVLHRALAGFKDDYSLVLAAYMSGKKVDVWVDGTCFGGAGGTSAYNVGIAFSIKD